MKYVGAHVSASGGVENAPLNAYKIGAKSFALFSKNQKQWFSKQLTANNIDGHRAEVVRNFGEFKKVSKRQN